MVSFFINYLKKKTQPLLSFFFFFFFCFSFVIIKSLFVFIRRKEKNCGTVDLQKRSGKIFFLNSSDHHQNWSRPRSLEILIVNMADQHDNRTVPIAKYQADSSIRLFN